MTRLLQGIAVQWGRHINRSGDCSHSWSVYTVPTTHKVIELTDAPTDDKKPNARAVPKTDANVDPETAAPTNPKLDAHDMTIRHQPFTC